jgi:molybdate transport system regulatory protein
MAKLSFRVDLGSGRAIGRGKIELLEGVRDHGSISAAGRSMGMSYRKAWLLIAALNEHFKEPVVHAKHGGAAGGGAELTVFGHRAIRLFRAIETKAHAAAAAELKELQAHVKL